MTPEAILCCLVEHSQTLDVGTPDPLQIAARDRKVGKARPQSWRLLMNDNVARIEIRAAQRSALGSEKHITSRHRASEVAADALVGMFDRNWQTLQVAIGIGDRVRPDVAARLLRIAYRLQKEERVWPDKVRRRPCACGRSAAPDYIPDLVQLVILQLEEPWLFTGHRIRYQWFGMSESHWHGVMRQPFDAVSAHLWSWYHAGIGHIQNRIVQRSRDL